MCSSTEIENTREYDKIRQNTTKYAEYDKIRQNTQNTTKYAEYDKIRQNTTKYDKYDKYDKIRHNTTNYAKYDKYDMSYLSLQCRGSLWGGTFLVTLKMRFYVPKISTAFSFIGYF